MLLPFLENHLLAARNRLVGFIDLYIFTPRASTPDPGPEPNSDMDTGHRVAVLACCTAAVCVAVTLVAAWRTSAGVVLCADRAESSPQPRSRRRTAADSFFAESGNDGEGRGRGLRRVVEDSMVLSSDIAQLLRSRMDVQQLRPLVVELLAELAGLSTTLCRLQKNEAMMAEAWKQKNVVASMHSVHMYFISLEALLTGGDANEAVLENTLRHLKAQKSILESPLIDIDRARMPPTPPPEAQTSASLLLPPPVPNEAYTGLTPCADSSCWLGPPPEYSPPAATSAWATAEKSKHSQEKRVEKTSKWPGREDQPGAGDPLYDSVENNDMATLAELLINGEDPYGTFGSLRRTLLHQAAHLNHIACLTVLLRHGAVMNTEDVEGDTALHLAAWAGNVETVSVLLAFGAEVDWLSGRDGYSPLWCAISAHQLEVARMLLRHGARADLRSSSGGGLALLHQAAITDQSAVIELLLEHGAQIDSREDDSNTPLHYAAASGSVASVEVLLRNGADIEARQAHGLTAVHWAAHKGHTKVLRKLLDRGAMVDRKAEEGATPLHLAANRGHLGAAQLLLERGARRDHGVARWSNSVGTPKELAEANGFVELAKML